jgi:hypothetical protein
MSAGLALAADPDVAERCADPAQFVMAACERARAWLREALEHGEIEQIAEARSQAEAVRVYTAQKQLGKDAQLAATEIVRRAERGIGVAIRKGQQAGQIRRRGQGSKDSQLPGDNRRLPSPTDFATGDELFGNGAGIYHMADGVSDEDFEAVLAEARAEENMSRANIVRKLRQLPGAVPAGPAGRALAGDVEQAPGSGDRSPEAAARRLELTGELAARGMTSSQIGQRLGIGGDRVRALAREHGIGIPADAATGRARHLDANRIVRETAHALEGLVMSAGLIDSGGLDGLDPAAAGWAASITRSARELARFARQVKERTT